MLFWILYVFTFPLIWFEKRYILADPIDDRPIWFHPNNRSTFWIFRLIVTYGTFLGLWLIYNYLISIIAFLIYFIFGAVVRIIYRRREVAKLAKLYLDIMMDDAIEKGEEPDLIQIASNALILAKRDVLKRLQMDHLGRDMKPWRSK